MDFTQILTQAKTFFLFRVLSIASVFLFSILITRLYGSSIKGEVDMILTVNNLLFAVFSLSITSSITLFVSNLQINLEKIHLKLIILSFIYFFICSIIIVLNNTFDFYIIFVTQKSALFFFLLILLSATYFYFSMVSAILSGQLQFYKLNLILILKNVIPILLIITFHRLIPLFDVVNFLVLSLIIGNFSCALLGSISIVNNGGEMIPYQKILRQGMLFHIGNIIQFFNYRLDVFILNKFVSLSQLAYYNLSVTISEALTQIPQLFSGMIFPLSAGDFENKTNQLNRLIRVTVTLSFLTALIIGVFGTFLIPIFFGEEFELSLIPMYLLLVAFVLFSYCNIIAAFFAGRKLQVYNTYAALIGLFVTLIGIFWIRNYGIIGAACVSLTSYSIIALFTIAKYLIMTKSTILDILPFRRLKEI